MSLTLTTTNIKSFQFVQSQLFNPLVQNRWENGAVIMGFKVFRRIVKNERAHSQQIKQALPGLLTRA
jgi:hypothetical protein